MKKAITNCGDMDATHVYYYDGQRMIEERNGSGQLLKTYVWGQQYIDELLAIHVPTSLTGSDSTPGTKETFWAMHDANYNVIGIVNESGRQVERYEYTPYGQRTIYGRQTILSDADEAAKWSNDATLTCPQLTPAKITGIAGAPFALNDFGHQGLMFNSESDQYSNRYRMYSPTQGRFMQRDPAGYKDRKNLYQSRRNNPLRYVDAMGLWGSDIHKELTTELAKLAGINEDCAGKIGEWADKPDSGLRRPGILGVLDATWVPYSASMMISIPGAIAVSHAKIKLMAEWHFSATDGEVIPGSMAAWAKAGAGLATCNWKAFAEGLHVYQDSWSHQGKPYTLGVGHGRGYDPKKDVVLTELGAAVDGSADNTDFWPATTRQMAAMTYRALVMFLQQCPNHCPPDPKTKCTITSSGEDSKDYEYIEKELLKRYPGEDKGK